MKKLYIFIIYTIAILLNTGTANAQFSQVSNTCIGNFNMTDETIQIGDSTFSQLGINEDAIFTMNIPAADSVEINVTALSHIGGAGEYIKFYADAARTIELYDYSEGIKTFRTSSNTVVFYLNNKNNTNKADFSFSWKGILAADGTSNDITCFGAADGSAQVFPNSGTYPYTYQWSDASTAETRKITGLASTGDYTVLITDTNGCSFDTTFHITEPAALDTSTNILQHVCLNGGATGKANIVVTGGTRPYSYSWNGGSYSSDSVGTNLSVTNKSYAVKDANGCPIAGSVGLEQPSTNLNATTSQVRNITCNNGANGEILITPADGLGTVTAYQWDVNASNQTTQKASGLKANINYNYTITDDYNCSYSASSIALNEPIPIDISLLSKTNESYYGSKDGAIDINVTNFQGTTVSYAWTGADAIAANQDQVDLGEDTYNVTVTDDSTCQANASYLITSPGVLYGGQISFINTAVDDTLCVAEIPKEIVSTTDASSPNPITYSWEFNDGTWKPYSPSNNAVGITPTNAITQDILIRRVANDGSTTEYSNSLSLKLSDISATASILNHITCFGYNNGSAEIYPLGGRLPYTYDWDTGAQDTKVSVGLSPGSRPWKVTDDNGCIISGTVIVNEPAALDTTTNILQHVCLNGGATGKANIVVTGGTRPYSYSWNGGSYSSDSVGTNLSVTNKSYAVKDANGCPIAGSVGLEQPSTNLNATTSQVRNITCNNGANGEILITPADGLGTVTAYQWDVNAANQTTQKASGLKANINYNYTITDDYNCSYSASSIALNEPIPIDISLLSKTNESYYGSKDGAIDINVTNFQGTTVSYAWTGADAIAANQDQVDLGEDTYNVTVTDDSTCQANASYLITSPGVLYGGQISFINTAVDDTLCVAEIPKEIVSTTDASSPNPITYSWEFNDGTWKPYSPSNNAVGITPTNAIIQDILIRRVANDGSTTEYSNSLSLKLSDISATASILNHITCFGYNNGSAEIYPLGGRLPYTYDWDTGAQDTKVSVGLSPGNRPWKVTDKNGCIISGTVIVNEPAALDTTTNILQHVCLNGGATGKANIVVTGGTRPYSYSWNGGSYSSDSVGTNLSVTTKSYAVKDANECPIAGSVGLKQPSTNLSATTSQVRNITCNNGANGEILITPADGLGTVTAYQWDVNAANQTTQKASGLKANINYNYTITDDYNCSYSASSIALNEPIPINISLLSKTNESYYGAKDGAIDINVTNFQGTTVSYAWTGADAIAANQDQVDLGEDTYNLTATDDSTCQANASYLITSPGVLYGGQISFINTAVDDTLCVAEIPKEIVSTTDASGPNSITYSWEYYDGTWKVYSPSDDAVGITPTNPITQDILIRRVAFDGSSTEYSNSLSLILIPNPVLEIQNLDSEYCFNSDTVTLIGYPTNSNGVFSGDGIISNNNGFAKFLPNREDTVSNPIVITYTYTESGCTTDTFKSTIVRPVPDPTFTIKTNISTADGFYKIIDANPTGGSFSGEGITPAGTFYTDGLTIGQTYPITYQVPNEFSCVGTTTDSTTIIEGTGKFYTDAAKTIELGDIFCYDGEPFEIYAKPFNTEISGSFELPIAISGFQQGTFTPSAYKDSVDNKYLITYSYTDGKDNHTITKEIFVYNVTEEANILDLESAYCNYEQEITINANPLKNNSDTSQFVGYGITDNNLKDAKAIFNIGEAALINNNFYITYQYTHGLSGCKDTAMAPVTINGLPTVSFNTKHLFNKEGQKYFFENLIPSSEGIFTGEGVSNLDYSFSPGNAQLGENIITYSYTDANTCKNSFTDTLLVEEKMGAIDGIYAPNSIYCADGINDTIFYSPPNASYEYTPVKFTIDSTIMSSLIDTAVIVPDTLLGNKEGKKYTLQYYYTRGVDNTLFWINKDIFVDDIGTLSIEIPSADFCIDGAKDTLVGFNDGKIANWGTFSPPASNLDPGTIGVATYNPTSTGIKNIIYTYKSKNILSACIKTKEIYLTVHPKPILSFHLPKVYNIKAIGDTMRAEPMGGTYYPLNYFTSDTIFNPSLAGVGNHTITYDYTDTYGCNSTVDTIANVEAATGTIGNLDEYYCYDGALVTLTVSGITNRSTSPGKFIGKGITDNGDNTAIFNPKLAYDNTSKADGDSTATIAISFEYKGIDDSTLFSFVETTKIRNNGVIAFTNLNAAYCENEPEVILAATPPNGIFTVDGITKNIFNPGEITGTSSTVKYTFTDLEAGCTITSTKLVTIKDLPTLSINLPAQLCSNSPGITIVGYPRTGKITSLLEFSNLAGKEDSVRFLPSSDFIGDYAVSYEYTNIENGCTHTIDSTITVDTIPEISIKSFMPALGFCNVADAVEIEGQLKNGINAISGSFSGKGIVNPAQNNGKGTYNPLQAGVGEDKVIFTYTDNNFCTNSIDADVIINDLPEVSIVKPKSEYCENSNEDITLNGYPKTGISLFTIGNRTFDGNQKTFRITEYVEFDTLKITYWNQSDKLCENEISDTILINRQPVSDFNYNNICIAAPITFSYADPNSIDKIDSLYWDFGDETTLSGKIITKDHQYIEKGLVTASLIATDTNGCFSITEKNLALENNPDATFSWKYECISDAAVNFESTSQETSYEHIWDFGDGTSSSSTRNPNKTYENIGEYHLKHTVQSTNSSSCKSVEVDTIYIRPTYTISALNDYYESFEEGHGYWIPELLDTASTNYSWEFGEPTGTVINKAAEGANIYATNLSGHYNLGEISAITSPCFVFDDIDRPMISMDIFKDFDDRNNGAVIEYTKDAGKTWSKLGEVGEGINWFNSENIRSKPGSDESNLGWAFNDSTWQDSRQVLDMLKNATSGAIEETVRFRIAFSSASDDEAHEGFAFDNIRIGERTRRVLIEHFTNSEISLSSNNTINNIVSQLPLDAIDIQYHTSYSANDQLYKEYPLGSNSREAFYGANTIPYSYFDGFVKFDFNTSTPTADKVMSRALTNPEFNMSLNVVRNNSSMAIELNLESREAIQDRKLKLYTAVVEKSVKLNTTSGELEFENVLRRFIPNPAGTYLNNTWAENQTENINYEYFINDYIDNPDTLIVIAFIQDEKTKQILQAVTNDKTSVGTAIKPWLKANQALDFIVYPNPADNKAYFTFGKNPSANSAIHIIDQNGKLIDVIHVAENSLTAYYELSNIPEGLYYVRWINNEQQKIKKLIIIH